MKRVFLLSILFTSAGIFTPLAHAQFTAVDPLLVSINPQYPKPHDTVTVTPSSTLVDLSASSITVSVNGVVINKTTGTASSYVQVGGAGETTNITVTAINEGQTYTKKLSVRPADVSLITESVSTTHPFYDGAPLVAAEGRVRLIAVPEFKTAGGSLIPASSLVYTWKQGDQKLESSSGIGKSILNATAPLRYRDVAITVTVATADSSVVAQTSTLVSPTDPILRIYRNDPLLGPIFSHALPASVAMVDSEETFRVVPYYFATTPSLSWQVNGKASETGQDITVRGTGSGKGTAYLGVTAKYGQSAGTAAMSVQFGVAKSLGIFGL